MKSVELEKWARWRQSGQAAFVRRFVFVSTSVFATSVLIIKQTQSGAASWLAWAVGVAFYAIVMRFVAKAMWQQNETKFLKQTSNGA